MDRVGDETANDAPAARAKDISPSKLYLVPFVGEGVGAPTRVEGEAMASEATTIAQRGDGVFISAPSAGHAHRLAQRVLEARVMLRQLRESSDAYRDGYASALRELGAFLASEKVKIEQIETSAPWLGAMAEIEAIETWLAGRQ